jgi:glycine/D-amino acid oxidase-like deaminating enzyme
MNRVDSPRTILNVPGYRLARDMRVAGGNFALLPGRRRARAQNESVHVHQFPGRAFHNRRAARFPAGRRAAGFSGHGFEFCSVVGEIVADLILYGGSRHDIGLFRLGRFGAQR